MFSYKNKSTQEYPKHIVCDNMSTKPILNLLLHEMHEIIETNKKV